MKADRYASDQEKDDPPAFSTDPENHFLWNVKKLFVLCGVTENFRC